MSSLALFFVGSVLLCNGLGLIGVLKPKETAPINLFVGLTLVATVAVVALPVIGSTEADRSALLGVTGFLLFAFTYLYVAMNNFFDLPGAGLGWYCGWAVGISLYLSWINFGHFDDAKFGFIWAAWAVLFAAFFVLLALRVSSISNAVGWLTILEAFTTTTIPGALMLTGDWANVSAAVVGLVHVGVVGTFLAMAFAQYKNRDSLVPVPS